MNNKDLTTIFGRFVGQKVEMKNNPQQYQGKTYDEWWPAKNDPTIAAIEQTAQEHGLSLRLWWPGMVSTTDNNANRLNAHIERDEKGIWRIENKFSLG